MAGISLTNGFISATATPFTGGTVTGETTFTGGLSATTLTADTITSPSLFWVSKDQNTNGGVITTKDSNAASTLRCRSSFITGGRDGGNTIVMSDSVNCAIFAANDGDDIRKSNQSSIQTSQRSLIYNVDNSSIISSFNSAIGYTDLPVSTNLGDYNSIISSIDSTIYPLADNEFINNSALIGCNNVEIFASNGERVVAIGMKDYNTAGEGLHVQNLYIHTGASENRVLASTGDNGRGLYKRLSEIYDVYDGGGASQSVEDGLSGGTATSTMFFQDINGGSADGENPTGLKGYIKDRISDLASYIFSDPINLLSIKSLDKALDVTLPEAPQKQFYVVKDVSGEAGTYNITISSTNNTINGESNFIIDLNTKPSVTFFWDGAEYITI